MDSSGFEASALRKQAGPNEDDLRVQADHFHFQLADLKDRIEAYASEMARTPTDEAQRTLLEVAKHLDEAQEVLAPLTS